MRNMPTCWCVLQQDSVPWPFHRNYCFNAEWGTKATKPNLSYCCNAGHPWVQTRRGEDDSGTHHAPAPAGASIWEYLPSPRSCYSHVFMAFLAWIKGSVSLTRFPFPHRTLHVLKQRCCALGVVVLPCSLALQKTRAFHPFHKVQQQNIPYTLDK